jgi:hypothetical protein
MHQALHMGRCYMTCSEIFLWDLSIIFYGHYNFKMSDDMSDEMLIFTQSSMGLKMSMCSNWTWTFGFSSTHLPTCMEVIHHHTHLGRCIHACYRCLRLNWALVDFSHPSFLHIKIPPIFFMKSVNPLIRAIIELRFDIWRSNLTRF